MIDADATVWICKKCHKDFLTESRLGEHSRSHVGKHEAGVYRCNYNKDYKCNFVTDRIEKLNIHRSEMHGDI
jgi:hypothetical protein